MLGWKSLVHPRGTKRQGEDGRLEIQAHGAVNQKGILRKPF
jgi:hypothetical protein